MQTFNLINAQDRVKKSRATINANFEAVASNFSGIAFPTVNLYVGMKCYRTDLNQTFTLNNVELQTWVDDSNIADKAITTEKLADQSVTKEKIAPNAITTEKITNGAVTKDKIAPGVLTASNVGAYDKAATYNRDEIIKSFRKIGDKVVEGNIDWNTLTEPTTYKIQSAIMNDAHHAPPNEYNFGILVVHRLIDGADHESRTVQVYYPHSTRGYWSRMLNGSGWLEWRYIPTHNEVQTVAEQKASTRVNKSGDTMIGALNFANNTWNQVGDDVLLGDKDHGGRLCIKSTTSNKYTGIAFFNPNNENDSLHLYYNHNKNTLFSTKWIGTENNVGGIYGYVYGNDSHWKLWGSDHSRPSTAYDIVGVGTNAEKGVILIRKYVNGTEVVLNKIIAEDNNTYFQHAVNAATFYANDWFRAKGNTGFYFQDHGGGWYMQDDTWIKSWGSKSIYTAGRMKADGGFEGKASSAGRADSSTVSDRAVRVENDNTSMRFHWSGLGGQPTWLWGGNNPGDMYVYNPSNFTVSRANTAGRADTADNATNAINATNATKARQIDGNVLVFSNGTKIWVE
nr:MAG TPA: shufflon protein [Caudoviricetes sp.]